MMDSHSKVTQVEALLTNLDVTRGMPYAVYNELGGCYLVDGRRGKRYLPACDFEITAKEKQQKHELK